MVDRVGNVGDQRRYRRAAELYLQRCYAAKTAARVSEFAAFLGLRRTRLHDEVRRIFGRSPRIILRDLQLERARWLLVSTTARPADIALASAFGTVNTFYRAFSERFGMTPEQYRERTK